MKAPPKPPDERRTPAAADQTFSPPGQRGARDGTVVEIESYEDGKGDGCWKSLTNSAPSVWGDSFPTDGAAFAEALKTKHRWQCGLMETLPAHEALRTATSRTLLNAQRLCALFVPLIPNGQIVV
ncbi:hypothetical protein BPMI_00064 [Candidatus Burkholderia pumila]|uniref:Uncharacterized protein n=1 Tax=Candidatus Burkholderia pumila TaxID=1090375 RepID=A0ABR5HKK5_9BURK|nr:hypothetical protein BPMI_00064 [Candidatus Burkholderia pumila]